MSRRWFRYIGRSVLAACAVSLGTASLNAQTQTTTTTTTTATTASMPSGPNPSRMDIFMGYSYLGTKSVVKPQDVQFSAVNEGAALSFAYYLNKYVGGEVVGFANPNGTNDGFYGGYIGPIVRVPMQDFTVFAHGGVGGTRAGGPNSDNPATFEHEPYTWGASLMAGGGMDYSLPWFNHHLGLRLFEADYRYMHIDYGPVTSIPTGGVLGGRANVNAAELSSGLLLHLGSILPPPAVTYSCSVTTPTGSIYPGDVVTITGTATNLNPKRTAVYSWSSDAGTVSSTTNVVTLDTKTLSAGTYTVKGHVSEGKKPYDMADCSATVTVSAIEPPTVGCSANPSTVNPGEPSTITANGVSPQNRPLTYSYSATAGSISGNTSTATLQTAGVAPGTISVTCNVVDDKGQSASQQTTVTVQAPAAPPAAATQSLCTISFDKDMRRPTRVDNEAKACLDDIALDAQRDPNAKLAIVGNSAPVEAHGRRHEHMEEHEAEHRAAERAVNEKAYLVNDKGIDAARISVYTGTAGTNTAATTIIPAGATFDTTGTTPVDEAAVKPIPRNAPARMHRHHHHHHAAAEAAPAANQ